MGTPQSASMTYSSCRVCTSEASSPASKRNIPQNIILAKRCSKGERRQRKGASSMFLVLSLRISSQKSREDQLHPGESSCQGRQQVTAPFVPVHAVHRTHLPCSCKAPNAHVLSLTRASADLARLHELVPAMPMAKPLSRLT